MARQQFTPYVVQPEDIARLAPKLNQVASALGGVSGFSERRDLVRHAIAADRWLGWAWFDQPLVTLDEIHGRGKQVANRFNFARDLWAETGYTIVKKPLASVLRLVKVPDDLLLGKAARNSMEGA